MNASEENKQSPVLSEFEQRLAARGIPPIVVLSTPTEEITANLTELQWQVLHALAIWEERDRHFLGNHHDKSFSDFEIGLGLYDINQRYIEHAPMLEAIQFLAEHGYIERQKARFGADGNTTIYWGFTHDGRKTFLLKQIEEREKRWSWSTATATSDNE